MSIIADAMGGTDMDSLHGLYGAQVRNTVRRCGNCVYRYSEDGRMYCALYGFDRDKQVDPGREDCLNWRGNMRGMVH